MIGPYQPRFSFADMPAAVEFSIETIRRYANDLPNWAKSRCLAYELRSLHDGRELGKCLPNPINEAKTLGCALSCTGHRRMCGSSSRTGSYRIAACMTKVTSGSVALAVLWPRSSSG